MTPPPVPHDRRSTDLEGEEGADFHSDLALLEAVMKRHLDRQDRNLEELRTLIIARNTIDDDIRPSLHEMALLWKASKIMIPFLVAVSAGVWAVLAWSKDHLKI